MVFQLDDVNQYLTSRTDKGSFFLLIPFDRDAGRRVGFQKFINRVLSPGLLTMPPIVDKPLVTSRPS